jgi:hypothetical protein
MVEPIPEPKTTGKQPFKVFVGTQKLTRIPDKAPIAPQHIGERFISTFDINIIFFN